MRIITITGYKGGVAKSCTAIHLATFFSDLGRTILIDGDPNRTAISWSQRGKLPFPVADERQAISTSGVLPPQRSLAVRGIGALIE
jgi:chromosome partitioning protein